MTEGTGTGAGAGHNRVGSISPPPAPIPDSPTQTQTPQPYLKPPTRSKDRTLFNITVLELVKLIQAALAISGMFPLLGQRVGGGGEMDGLLCDVTVEGIQKWVGEVGECVVGVEVGAIYLLGEFGTLRIICWYSRWSELRIRVSFLRY
jgi:hypothetical protein